MTQFIIKAGKVAQFGSMILQALSLVANITDHVSQRQQGKSSRQTTVDQHDPEDGE